MKKKILLALAIATAFTLKAGNLNVQSSKGDDKKVVLGVSVGAGIPLAAYGKADTLAENDSTHRNGWAKTGFHFDVTAGYLFAGSIGGMIYIGGNMNSFDATSYKTINGFNSSATVTAKSYYLGQYLIGPFLALPAGDKLKINLRLLVGLVTANTPTITVGENNNVTSTYSGKGGSGFGYQFGAGIQYNFSESLGMMVNIGYTGSSISYTGYTQSQTNPALSWTYTNTTLKQTMSMGLITATIGLAINL